MDIMLNAQRNGEMVVPLMTVLQACGAQVLHPHILVAAQSQEDVVLIGVKIVLGQLVNIIAMGEAQAMDRKFLIQ